MFTDTTPKLQPISKGKNTDTADNNKKSVVSNSTTMEKTSTRSTNYFKQSNYKQVKQSRNNNSRYGFLRNSPNSKSNNSNKTMNANFLLMNETTRYKHNTNQHSNFHPYQSFDPNTYVNKSQHGSNAKLKSFNSYNRNEHSNGNNDQFCNNNDNHNSNNYNNNNVNVNCPRNFRESTSYNTSYTNFNYNHLKFPNNTNNNNFNSPKTNRNNNNNNNNNKITQGRQYMKTCIISNASSDTFTAESANRKRENPFTKRSANFSQNDAKKRYVQQGPPLNDEEYKIKSKTNTKANRKNQNGRDKARNTRKTFNRSRGKGLPKKSYKNNVENFTGQKFNPNEDVEQGEEQKGEEKDNCEKENLEEEEADNCKENKKEEVNKEIRTDNTNAIKNVALKVEVTDKTLYNIEAKEFIQENNSNQLNLSVNEQIYSSNECSSVANVGENLEKSKKKRRSKTVSCDPSTENTVKEVEEISSETTKKDKKAKKPKEKKQKKLKESELDQELIADVAVEQENISVINSKRSALESINRSDTCSPKISLIPLTRLLAEEYLKLEDPSTNTDSNSRPISKHLGPTSNNPPPLKLKLLDQRNRSTCTEALSTTDACDAIMAKLTSMDKSSIKNIINTTDTKYDSALTSLARKRLREELRRQLKAINFDNSEQILNNDIVPDEICDSIHIPDRVLDEIRQVLGMDVYNNIPSNDVELSVNVLQKDEDKNNEMKKNIEHIEHFSLMPEEFSSGPSSALTESAQHNNHNNSLTDGNNLPTSTTQCNFGENLDEKNVTTGTVTKSLELCLKISPKRYRRNSSSSLMQHSAERDRTPVHPEQQNEQAIKLEKPAQYKNIKKKLMKKMKKMKKVRETKELLKKEAKKYMPEVIVIDSSTSSSSESSSSNSSASSSSSSSTTSSSTSDTDSDSTTYSSKSSASLKRKRLKLKFDAQNVIDSFDKLIVPSLSETLTDRYRMKYSTSVNTKLHFISCICTSEYNSEKFSKAEIEKIQKSLKSPDYSMALDFLMKQIVNVFNKQRKIAKSGEIKKLDNKKSDNSPLGKKSSLVINNKLKEQSPDVNNQISSTIETMPPDDDIRIKQCVSKMLSLYKEEMRAALESVKEKTITSKITDEYSKSLTEAIVEKQLPAAPDLSISEIVKGSKGKKDPKSKGDSNVLINNSQKRDNEVNINSQHNESEKHSSIITPQREQPKKQQMHQEKISVAKNGTAVCNENIRAIENMSNITSIDYNSFGYSDINSSTVALVQHSALASVDLDSFKQKHPIGEVVVNNLREIDLKLMELHKRKMFIEEMILKLQKEKMEADLLTIKLQNEKFILLNTAMTANATNNERQPTSNSPSTKSANYMTNIKVEKMEDVLSENSINQISEVNTTTDASNPKSNTNSNANAKLHSNLITGQKVLEVTSKNKGKVTTTLSSSTTTLPTSTTPSPSTRTTTTKRKNNGLMTTDQKTKRANNRKEGSTRSKDHSIKSNKIQGTSMENSSQKTTEINKTLLSPTSMPLAVTQSRNIDGIKSVINEIKVYEKNIVAGSEDGTLYMFDATTLKLITQFAKHTEAITQMYLCLEKRVIYTTSLDGYFKKTALENFELDVLSLYLQEPLQSLEVQWGIAYLGSRWGNIYTYNISENRVSENLLCTSTSSIIAIKATGNGTQKILIVSSKGNLVQLRDAITGLLLRTLDIPDTFNIYSILLDDNVIYCGTQKKEIYKYDLLSGSYLGSLSCGNGAVSMQIYNRYIFVGCYDGFIYILDKLTSILKDRLPGSGKMVLALEIYNNKIITSAKDRTMKIIDIPDYCLLHN